MAEALIFCPALGGPGKQKQRNTIALRLRKTPSLQASFSDTDWWADARNDALAQAAGETGIHYQEFPAACP